jgi:hypothetical protein
MQSPGCADGDTLGERHATSDGKMEMSKGTDEIIS